MIMRLSIPGQRDDKHHESEQPNQMELSAYAESNIQSRPETSKLMEQDEGLGNEAGM